MTTTIKTVWGTFMTNRSTHRLPICLVCVAIIALAPACGTIKAKVKVPKGMVKNVAHCVGNSDSGGMCTTNTTRVTHIQQSMVLDRDDIPDQLPRITDADITSIRNGAGNRTDQRSLRLKTMADRYKTECTGLDYSKKAAQVTTDVLNSPLKRALERLFQSQGTTLDKAAVETTFSSADIRRFSDDLATANASGGFDSLNCYARSQVIKLTRFDASQNIKIAAAKEPQFNSWLLLEQETSFTRSYLRAYFRGGQFIKASLKVSELYDRIRQDIIDRSGGLLSDAEADELTKKVIKKLTGKDYAKLCPANDDCQVDVAGKLNSKQYITRAGASYGFPHITLAIDPLGERKLSITDVNWNDIAGVLIKVYVEALGDKWAKLPAVRTSTAVEDKLLSEFKPAVEPRDDTNPAGVTQKNFDDMDEWAGKIDSLVSQAVGRAVRGASWFSLNNEALAVMIETAFGTASRKIAEKVLWCIETCKDMGFQNRSGPQMELEEFTFQFER
jgi:hypothetical protein